MNNNNRKQALKKKIQQNQKNPQNQQNQINNSVYLDQIKLLETQILFLQARAKGQYGNSSQYIGQLLLNMLKRYFTALFKWSGLPKYISPQWVNHILINHGRGTFFKVGEIIMFLPFTSVERSLLNGEPFKFQPTTPVMLNGQIEQETEQSSNILNKQLVFRKHSILTSNAVPIYFNSNEQNLRSIIGELLNRLGEIYTALRTDMKSSSTSFYWFVEPGSEIAAKAQAIEMESNFNAIQVMTGNPGFNKNSPLGGKQNMYFFDVKTKQSEYRASFNHTVQLIGKLLGLADSYQSNKTAGTQETDGQVIGQKTISGVLISNFLNAMRLNLKAVNTLFKLNIEVTLDLDILEEVKELLNAFAEQNIPQQTAEGGTDNDSNNI